MLEGVGEYARVVKDAGYEADDVPVIFEARSVTSKCSTSGKGS
jgi:hypothetical protein